MIAIQIFLAAILIVVACITIKNIRRDRAAGRNISYLYARFRKRKILHQQNIPVRCEYLFCVLILVAIVIYVSDNYSEYSIWLDMLTITIMGTAFIYCMLVAPNMPIAIGIDSEEVLFSHVGWIEFIRFDDILSIKVDTPDRNVRRISGSIGVSGNWGKREDGSHGKYYACYGKRDKCVFIRLYNGDGYMLGADNPEKFVEEAKKAMEAYRLSH